MGIIQKQIKIREELKRRFELLKLSNSAIIKDAKEIGNITIHPSALSRYLNNKPSTLHEETIIWLAYRYMIFVTIHVGSPILRGNKLTMEVPAYDEDMAINTLRKIFPSTTQKKISTQK